MDSPQAPWIDMPTAELAAVILPWFESQPPQDDFVTKTIAKWLYRGSTPKGFRAALWSPKEPFQKPDIGAVAEALQLLEHAGLLLRSHGSDGGYVGLSRLGRHALATDAVRQYLRLSGGTPPTG
jgi:hypothetical protein